MSDEATKEGRERFNAAVMNLSRSEVYRAMKHLSPDDRAMVINTLKREAEIENAIGNFDNDIRDAAERKVRAEAELAAVAKRLSAPDPVPGGFSYLSAPTGPLSIGSLQPFAVLPQDTISEAMAQYMKNTKFKVPSIFTYKGVDLSVPDNVTDGDRYQIMKGMMAKIDRERGD